jgi:hypothetical protein
MSEIEPCTFHGSLSVLGGRFPPRRPLFYFRTASTHPAQGSRNVSKAGGRCSTPVCQAKRKASGCYLLAPHFLLMDWAMSVPFAKV